MNPSAGDTVIATNTSSETTGESLTLENGCQHNNLERSKSKTVTRKRRQIKPSPSIMDIPRKTSRHEDLSSNNRRIDVDDVNKLDENQRRSLKRPLSASINSLCKELKNKIIKNRKDKKNDNNEEDSNSIIIIENEFSNTENEISSLNHLELKGNLLPLSFNENEISNVIQEIQSKENETNQKKQEVNLNLSKDKMISCLHRKPPDVATKLCRRKTEKVNDVMRLRKTIQWLEEGARRMREDLAAVRSELHEERKAAKLARRDLETAIRDARVTEAAKNQQIISDLKVR